MCLPKSIGHKKRRKMVSSSSLSYETKSNGHEFLEVYAKSLKTIVNRGMQSSHKQKLFFATYCPCDLLHSGSNFLFT